MADCKPVLTGWEFVEKPPEKFQSDCPVCLCHLWEPYQVTCCGYSFCQACIEQVKDRNGCCPKCKTEEYNVLPNKGPRRSLHKYEVNCCYQNDGCPWKGALGDLDGHLSLQRKQMDTSRRKFHL